MANPDDDVQGTLKPLSEDVLDTLMERRSRIHNPRDTYKFGDLTLCAVCDLPLTGGKDGVRPQAVFFDVRVTQVVFDDLSLRAIAGLATITRNLVIAAATLSPNNVMARPVATKGHLICQPCFLERFAGLYFEDAGGPA